MGGNGGRDEGGARSSTRSCRFQPFSHAHTQKKRYTYRDGIFRNYIWIYLVHAPVDDVKYGSLMERQHRISVPIVNVPFLFL